MQMESASPKDSSSASSPFSSPSVAALLKIKIISWSQETGLPVSVRVRVAERTFHLHRNPLFSRSGYFKRRLIETTQLELPQTFPGGPETFEMIALFMYGSSTLIDPFNVAALRCAAEFLEMTEEFCSGNLCERFDLYLNQVVLQNWDDTLIVLQRCQALIPWSEELLIVSRCIESLAFMACMEILDPERRRDKPVITLEALAGQAWSCEAVKEILSQELWIKGPHCSTIWILQKDNRILEEARNERKICEPHHCFLCKQMGALQEDDTILGELRSVGIGLRNDSRVKLQDQIASLLHFAHVEDLLIPSSGVSSDSSSMELATMESIFSTNVSLKMDTNNTPSAGNSIVAELWDTFLSHIASDPKIRPKRFMELIETVPISCRQSHDQLYRAMNTFLQAHPVISQEEKGAVCKYLNCQKLSQWACIDAVQNEMMPLRLIVQALFVQQLNTHQAFKECSDSFRYAQSGEFSGSLSSTRCANTKSQYLADSPYMDGAEPGGRTLSFLLQKDIAVQRCEFSRKEYESTSFRIQNLEQELFSLKKSLQLQKPSKRAETLPAKPQSAKPYGLQNRSLSRNRNPLGHVTGCIGSVNFASQRKYASKLLKIFRRITLFGSRKSKRKSGVPSLWGKPM
ncbi:hypothetical protein OIU77_011064 [Salix suchowensis]|uniref:Phototropic-responsive NPH3 family protein n=1 Tax=Salix suchowensis TaxID=1278906 RepID=A0ABQ9AAG9_9ROSI|nr:hypothetical protein OIU77_011064 [Salix suchowensis]